MKINRLMIEAAIVGVLLLITVLAGLGRAANPASAVNSIASPPDTETIARLTRAYNIDHPADLQATTTVTGTNGTLVAIGLSLGQPYYGVDLPLIMK